MSGPIPPEPGRLTHLKNLTLFDNELSGPIRPELGRLTALRYSLELSGNQLSGPIAALETRLVRWMVALAGIVVAAQRFL